MDEGYEALGPSASAPPPSYGPMPPMQFVPVPTPSQPVIVQFPPAVGSPPIPAAPAPPSAPIHESESSDKQSEPDVRRKKRSSRFGPMMSRIGCMLGCCTFLILLFIGIVIIVLLVAIVWTDCFGHPECPWIRIIKL
ncbi:unnamed protein product [Thelazia callipaeda]|uniref:LITAF domain-containing protein n=1 Tax=Thelazia callipaeda TaxID=103827 RepID=A0A0N5CPH7_THECL|nr:unnamed protein product [Thelazia callipaeda]